MKRSKSALLLLDFISLFDFAHSEKLAKRAVLAARHAAALKARARRAGIACIYANDNYGDWRSEFAALVTKCKGKRGASEKIATLLEPDSSDLSVLKPRHSAFFGSPLEFLLDELHVRSLIITGISADICVFATAHDAHIRKLKLWIPADCVAADTAKHEAAALELMERTMGAKVARSTAASSFDGVRL